MNSIDVLLLSRADVVSLKLSTAEVIEVVTAALPWRLDGVRPGPTAAGPVIGEHTHQLLRDVLGLSDDEIAAHEAAGSLE